MFQKDIAFFTIKKFNKKMARIIFFCKRDKFKKYDIQIYLENF